MKKNSIANLNNGQASNSREKIVRQGRLELAGDDAILKSTLGSNEIYDVTPFGLAIIADSNFENLNTFEDVEIYYKNILINIVHLRVVRKEPFSSNQFKYACEILGEPVDIEKIKAIKLSNSIIHKHQNFIAQFASLPEEFKRIVYEMKDWLETLKTSVNSIDYKMDLNKTDEYSHYENVIANIVGDYIVKTFEGKYKYLETSLSGINKELLMTSFEFFRSKMKELLLEAPFHNRAYNKPLGYAGDYQMMNQIYAYEGLGGSLFAKCLHLYFISAPESRAVRNRAKYLQDQITTLVSTSKNKIKILSVASGPIMEIQYFLKDTPEFSENVEFYFLDQDLESLQHAQRVIKNIEREKNIKVNCKFINKAIKHVIVGGIEHENFDLIYTAGLFDYFTDPVAQMCGQKLYDALSSKGKLIIGNFSTTSPGKITMDIALDWHLIYRSNEDLENLFSHIAEKFYIEHEKEGINLFCHLVKGS